MTQRENDVENLADLLDREIAKKQLVDLIDKALSTLNPQEECALRHLYGIGTESGKKRKVKEAAAIMGLSETRFVQIRDRALFKLRKSSFALLLADWWYDIGTEK